MHSFEHIVHSISLGVILYVGMVYGLKQDKEVALDRSTLITAVFLAYMVLFGHNLPTNVNKNIF
jgi:hypothetical protein